MFWLKTNLVHSLKYLVHLKWHKSHVQLLKEEKKWKNHWIPQQIEWCKNKITKMVKRWLAHKMQTKNFSEQKKQNTKATKKPATQLMKGNGLRNKCVALCFNYTSLHCTMIAGWQWIEILGQMNERNGNWTHNS